jgi:maltooligosyltrehalose trehalohydrolase
MRVGALYRGDGSCLFRVFAPLAAKVEVEAGGGGPKPLFRGERGYWEAGIDGVRPGERYLYRIDDRQPRPDPASASQPDGVHGPSQVWDHASFHWTDGAWRGLPLDSYLLYEIHPGAFTPEGTLDAVASKLPHLEMLGVNALEIMPVNQFPGARNWGYDGAYPYAVQNSYGGPDALKRLVDACHARGFAVVLDVVYNHLGPEGNYLQEFAPYFSDRYRTPWGSAVNFDGPWSDQVRDYVVENALYWFREFHVDALRIDAVHQIYDMSARHILAELQERVADFSARDGRIRYLIAESDLNDPRVLNGKDAGGYGLDAQWLDDFQHSVDAMLRGKASAYTQDFGAYDQFPKALRSGFVFDGAYAPSRRRSHGASSALRPASQFVVFLQNHDQVGNRPRGERLNAILDFESYKLAAGAMILSPYIPLLFMGEEYAESNPFQFFADFGDPALKEAVRKGRKEEFAFLMDGGEVPDPIDAETFQRSRLDWERPTQGRHATAFAFYRELIALRKSLPALCKPSREGMELSGDGLAYLMLRRADAEGEYAQAGETSAVCVVFNFGADAARVQARMGGGEWALIMDSADPKWGGTGSKAAGMAKSGDLLEASGRSFLLYKRM